MAQKIPKAFPFSKKKKIMRVLSFSWGFSRLLDPCYETSYTKNSFVVEKACFFRYFSKIHNFMFYFR